MLRFLRAYRSATVSQLLTATGVSRSAIRQRLARLQALGLICREPIRRGRGRPYYVYRLTREGEQEFGWLLPDLAAALWTELSGQADEHVRKRLTDSLAQKLAGPIRANLALSAGMSRIRSFVSLLRRQGTDIELDLSGQWPVVRQYDCPFGALARDTPGICKLSQAIIRYVLESDVLICCCRAKDKEAGWCDYRVQTAAGHNPALAGNPAERNLTYSKELSRPEEPEPATDSPAARLTNHLPRSTKNRKPLEPDQPCQMVNVSRRGQTRTEPD